MDIELRGVAAAQGWPAPGCRCASCGRLRAAGVRHEPFAAAIDGVALEDLPRTDVPGGYEVLAPGGGRALVAAGPGARPEPSAGVEYGAVLLDMAGSPDHLGYLRHTGSVTPLTQVVAVHLDHRLPSPSELERRTDFWKRSEQGPFRTLLLGGSRSGKSAEAELRLAACSDVLYIATGPVRDDDPEWAERVAAHRLRRPAWWRTTETTELAGALASASGPVLVDGVGTWLAAAMSETDAWEEPSRVLPLVDGLVAAWRGTAARVVAVSDEVGLSLVPTTVSGRAFRDVLGQVNQRLAAESEEAALVVAGRVMELR
ncbi:adenosylcobinamide kinase /adenosylcobinamide-phosphate guanylyltransferase [Actinomadura glauciflava]|uniref:bifunctional adenosylcobinamide kinase/adenosylcobinamide-phosphate guanylyltransferase n=1 Tax=Actinomadura luteofluorescens TaxID=46163 RepID=UPI0021644D02|nr:bifunctional adenosylcobinamide kinase/adenosylcobinamide-phosphate guanylyltransferase [Actinomadura glauciflava]MCR3737952.1 adenosylcobinamide kinase /adenosylcobinamide-phosphate guanylyltransferase [Actinomadura glauciflava]